MHTELQQLRVVEKRILLVGAGGHGKVVADALQVGGKSEGLSFVDDLTTLWGKSLMGLPVLGPLKAAVNTTDRVHVAIGNNLIRQRVAGSVDAAQLLTVAHPDAHVSPHALVGVGSFIAASAVLGPCVQIGAGVIVNHGAVVDHDCVVGDFCHVAPLASLAGKVCIGSGVLIGAGARILPGVKIGSGAVIGAGAVVNKDVAPGATVVGIPACEISRSVHGSKGYK